MVHVEFPSPHGLVSVTSTRFTYNLPAAHSYCTQPELRHMLAHPNQWVHPCPLFFFYSQGKCYTGTASSSFVNLNDKTNLYQCFFSPTKSRKHGSHPCLSCRGQKPLSFQSPDSNPFASTTTRAAHNRHLQTYFGHQTMNSTIPLNKTHRYIPTKHTYRHGKPSKKPPSPALTLKARSGLSPVFDSFWSNLGFSVFFLLYKLNGFNQWFRICSWNIIHRSWLFVERCLWGCKCNDWWWQETLLIEQILKSKKQASVEIW